MRARITANANRNRWACKKNTNTNRTDMRARKNTNANRWGCALCYFLRWEDPARFISRVLRTFSSSVRSPTSIILGPGYVRTSIGSAKTCSFKAISGLFLRSITSIWHFLDRCAMQIFFICARAILPFILSPATYSRNSQDPVPSFARSSPSAIFLTNPEHFLHLMAAGSMTTNREPFAYSPGTRSSTQTLPL
jgi:hypothetical protein